MLGFDFYNKNNNLKLTMPTDIAEEELILSHRQRLIEDKLLNCYVIEVASIITALVVKNCNRCIIDHPSQRQHPCLTMESDERMWLYFDEALDVVCEAIIAENLMNSLYDIKPSVNGLELLKYTCCSICFGYFALTIKIVFNKST